MPAAESYFITWKGQRDGPYPLEHLAEMLRRGEISMMHRVETSAGLVPLRQLLIAADPARWSGHAVEHPGAGPLPPPPAPTPREPVPTTAQTTNVSSPGPTPAPGNVATANFGQDESPQAVAAYLLCGMSFLVPPLAWWAQKLAKVLENQGSPKLAGRLRMLSLGLAAGGVIFWVLLLLFWRKW